MSKTSRPTAVLGLRLPSNTHPTSPTLTPREGADEPSGRQPTWVDDLDTNTARLGAIMDRADREHAV
jgi:hypothetical protein